MTHINKCLKCGGDLMYTPQTNEFVCDKCGTKYTNDQTEILAAGEAETIGRYEWSDNVHHPSHYTKGGIECIEAIKASMSEEEFQGYLKGNVIKYLWRWREKGGLEDLQKAKVYLDWLGDSAYDEKLP